VHAKRVIHAVDAHAAGEPGRVIVGGMLDVPGDTMAGKVAWLQKEGDWLRQLMLREPRGYPAANCNLVVPPTRPDADAGFIIMEQVEYPAMSGSNTICVATVLIEMGLVPAEEPVTTLRLETPAGLVTVSAQVEAGRVRSVTFRNVPAFVVLLDAPVDVPGVGKVAVDVAWGGMFYVIAEASAMGVTLVPDQGALIAAAGERLKLAAQEQLGPIVHPTLGPSPGITIAELTGPPVGAGATARNSVIVSTGIPSWDRPESFTGALDRSPCGTGTSARMAALHATGRLRLGEDFHHEGILGTVFTGRLVEETEIGGVAAVVPTITGRAWVTGVADYLIADDDPFPTGYTVGDLWGAW
jgi:proline racemase